MTALKDLRSLTQDELLSWVLSIGDKKFRAQQIHEWLWKKGATSVDQMSNLSHELRQAIQRDFSFPVAVRKSEQISNDGTIKCVFGVDQDKVVEGVLIPTPKRMTACISSQVGCSLACKFCATGRLKMMRNLTAGEIFDQVYNLKMEAENRYNIPLSNIVYMGMGEPLLNYKNVLQSIEHITSQKGLGMSAQRITVSTAGVAKMITKLGDDAVKFHLAVSLHAATDEKRNHIMEINETNNLEVLANSLRYYYEKTGDRVTFEYIIFKDFNDSLEDAKALAEYCKQLPVKINVIEYNPIVGGEYQQTTEERLKAFTQYLLQRNMVVNLRRSRGKDIDAACGQLANKNQSMLKPAAQEKLSSLL
jgi:23S rRNA (adenine2503-C2)-methyltransferase